MRHIPNILSSFRIVLIPFFVWKLLAGDTLLAALILGVSGITDLLDGMLARKYGWVSQLGKVLDPVSDKLTQITVSVTMAWQLRQYWYLFAILLLKELAMLVLGGSLVKKGIKLEGAKMVGKIATTFFYVCMTAIVLFSQMPAGLTAGLLFAVTATSLVAAVLYIPQYLQYKNKLKTQ